MHARYLLARLEDGWYTTDGESFFFASNPALGLWGAADRFAV